MFSFMNTVTYVALFEGAIGWAGYLTICLRISFVEDRSVHGYANCKFMSGGWEHQKWHWDGSELHWFFNDGRFTLDKDIINGYYE